jgi:hypothetical protein
MVYFDPAHVAPVPATTLNASPNGITVNLNWSGSSPAPAWSLKGYEVQYRDQTASTWTTLQAKTSTNTSGAFTGQIGHTYLVRARTWQRINESYQSDIDMPGDWHQQTVTLGALVSGRVTTNRGDGVSGVTVTETGSNASTTTADGGLFNLGVAGAGQYNFTVSAPGNWTAPPPLTVSVQLTSTPFLSFTLRPPDDTIDNGDFENDLTGWQVSGTPPASINSGQRSGSASLLLSDTVTMSQTDFISGSYQPVLSFWYKIENSDPNNSFTAELLNTDNLTPANSFVASTDSPWQQVWVPLNGTDVYTGPVGVRFSLAQAGGSQTKVYLDEVSLGASWGGPSATYLPLIFK